jgi:hypothetical protein
MQLGLLLPVLVVDDGPSCSICSARWAKGLHPHGEERGRGWRCSSAKGLGCVLTDRTCRAGRDRIVGASGVAAVLRLHRDDRVRSTGSAAEALRLGAMDYLRSRSTISGASPIASTTPSGCGWSTSGAG